MGPANPCGLGRGYDCRFRLKIAREQVSSSGLLLPCCGNVLPRTTAIWKLGSECILCGYRQYSARALGDARCGRSLFDTRPRGFGDCSCPRLLVRVHECCCRLYVCNRLDDPLHLNLQKLYVHAREGFSQKAMNLDRQRDVCIPLAFVNTRCNMTRLQRQGSLRCTWPPSNLGKA